MMCVLVGSYRLSSGDRQTPPPLRSKSSECAYSKEKRLNLFASGAPLASRRFGARNMNSLVNWPNRPSKAVLPISNGQLHHECSCAVAYGTMLSSLGLRRHKRSSTKSKFFMNTPPPANITHHHRTELQGRPRCRTCGGYGHTTPICTPKH